MFIRPLQRTLLCLTLATLGGSFMTRPAMALDLIEAVKLAEKNDARFAALEARKSANQFEGQIARSALLPQVGFKAGVNQVNTRQDPYTIPNTSLKLGGNSDYQQQDLSLSVVQPLFNLQVFRQYEAGLLNQSKEEQLLDEQIQKLILDVSEKYLSVIRTQGLAELAASREKLLDTRLREAQEKRKVGLTRKLDVMEIEAQKALATSDRLSAQSNATLAKSQLESLLGQAADGLLQLKNESKLAVPLPQDPKMWAKLAIKRSQAMKAAKLNAEALGKQRQSIESEYLPQLNLIGSVSKSDISGGDSNPAASILSGGRRDTLGVEMRWDVFSGGRTKAKAAQAGQLEVAAQKNLEAQEKALGVEVMGLHERVHTKVNQVQANAQLVQATQKNLEAIETGYKLGTHTITDVLNAETKLFSARTDLESAKYEYLTGSLQLFAKAGMLSKPVIARFNAQLQ